MGSRGPIPVVQCKAKPAILFSAQALVRSNNQNKITNGEKKKTKKRKRLVHSRLEATNKGTPLKKSKQTESIEKPISDPGE